MSKRINCLLSFICIACVATFPRPLAAQSSLELDKTSSVCTARPFGLVGWWALDESSSPTAFDLAGDNHGTHFGNPDMVPGIVDRALSFDGIDDHVEIPHDPVLDFGTGNFSIDLWLQTTSTSSTITVILDKRSSNPVRGYHLFLFKGFIGLQLADGDFQNFISQAFVADGQPHHIAVTVNRFDAVNGIRFYVDGLRVGDGDNPTLRSGSLDNPSPLRLGTSRGASSGFWDGILDEVQLYNRVLTASEVSLIALAGPAGKCKCVEPPCEPIAWWSFNNGSADDVAGDLSGPHHGTVEAAAPTGGKVEGALLFDGASSNVDVTHDGSLDLDLVEPSGWSVDGWIRTSAVGFQPIVSNTTPHPIDIGNIGYVLYLDDGTLGFGIQTLEISIAGGLCPAAACAGLADDVWHLVGATVTNDADGANVVVKLYVDGRWVYTFAPVDVVGSVLAGRLVIGAFFSQVSGFFEGKIDEVEIFDRALVEDDFASIFAADRAGKCEPEREPVLCGTRGGSLCDGDEFCDFELSFQSCGGPLLDVGGYCRPRPEECPQVLQPVCGCDGLTYTNACFAHRNSVSVDFFGGC